MLYVILSSDKEDRSDVIVVPNEDGSAKVFSDRTTALEWAEDNLQAWYRLVNV